MKKKFVKIFCFSSPTRAGPFPEGKARSASFLLPEGGRRPGGGGDGGERVHLSKPGDATVLTLGLLQAGGCRRRRVQPRGQQEEGVVLCGICRQPGHKAPTATPTPTRSSRPEFLCFFCIQPSRPNVFRQKAARFSEFPRFRGRLGGLAPSPSPDESFFLSFVGFQTTRCFFVLFGGWSGSTLWGVLSLAPGSSRGAPVGGWAMGDGILAMGTAACSPRRPLYPPVRSQSPGGFWFCFGALVWFG